MSEPKFPGVRVHYETPRYPRVERIPIRFSDLSFRFGMIVRDVTIDPGDPPYRSPSLVVRALAPERDGHEWIELQFRERLGPRYMEAGEEERRRSIAHVLGRMIEHEIMEGITLDDGSRPFDPHANERREAVFKIPFSNKSPAEFAAKLREELALADLAKTSDPEKLRAPAREAQGRVRTP